MSRGIVELNVPTGRCAFIVDKTAAVVECDEVGVVCAQVWLDGIQEGFNIIDSYDTVIRKIAGGEYAIS